ncbi:hypothetical protein M422DRAFT_264141 [Sphaerobolus stellatus SS14]|uniref:Peptidase A1 domain-containing protein n=1 Tax=Sphaerobolus stellatus (strain SS14) TaxID=990650 RepID=A0A0C9V8S6_SPHS4|nr:hypothetical protein M422DRAFT_264141 [Sphaerobolus stellatus SS14]
MRVFALALLLPAVLALSPPIVKVRDSPISVSIAARVNAAGVANFVEADCARARLFIQAAKDKTAKVAAGTLSAAAVIGVPSGTEFTDPVTLGSGLTIPKQSIGVASTSTGFSSVNGILGIGPAELTSGTLSPATSSLIPTITDNLLTQGTIPTDLIAVSFEPTNSESITNGELTFGGTDSSKFTGSITFAPITSTNPASEFWGISQTIHYGSATDTGTTPVLLASNAFSAYQKATGAVLDDDTGFLRLTTAQFANLKSLFFTIAGTTFELTANAQARPHNLNADIGGTANNLGTPTGQGLDFINGYGFLERFYSVFDTTNKHVGFATTTN